MKKLILLFLTLMLSASLVFAHDYVVLKKKMFPLPEKYRPYKTSGQGLREAIPNVNAVGGSSLCGFHNANDYACPDKTEVYATDDGIVVNVYPSYYNGEKWQGHDSYGGYIEIQHGDGTRSSYAHLSMTLVREGDEVVQGQVIGWSGGVKDRRGSGSSTGPHLHFSIYVDIDEFIN